MGFSAKHFEVVSTVKSGLTEDKIKQVIADLPCKYAYILHDKDVDESGKAKEPHWHVYVNFGRTSWNSENVAKRFGVTENFVGRIKGKSGDMLEYLTHQNRPEKYQYPEDDVRSNYDWQSDKERSLTKHARDKRADEIREHIVDGSWRDFNIHQFVTAKEFYEHKRVIENAFEYRVRTLRGANREMNAVYIYGDSGSGKTTLAKMMAEEHGMSVYVSSGSNDVLDDYKGEDCIILDDIRPSCMGLSDLLKMLDPNTSSTVKSRYRNKVLECKMIIITTTLSIDKFFANVFESENETAIQLKRRCEALFRLTPDVMESYVWLKKKREYMRLADQPNPVATKYKAKDMTLDEAQEYINSLLGSITQSTNQIFDGIRAGEFGEYGQIRIDEDDKPW